MKQKKSVKTQGPKVNIIGFGQSFEAGCLYTVKWYADGEFGFNEVCYIPFDERNPKQFFNKWLSEITQFITLPVIDIHISKRALTNDKSTT